MDVLVDGLGAVSHAAEDAGAAAGHGSSFTEAAARAHGAERPDSGSEANRASSSAERTAARPAQSPSWWDTAMGGMKSVGSTVDSVAHKAGAAVDQMAEQGISKATESVRH